MKLHPWEAEVNRKVGEKLYVQVFRQVRAYIIKNNLQPGDLLPTEQAMSEMLGVSRNVLREAIKAMEIMGMLSAQAGRGTVLHDFNLDFVLQNVVFAAANDVDSTIVDMLDIRKKLELGYMRLAYESLKPQDVARLRQILEAMQRSWEQEHFFHNDDRDFHLTLFSRVENSTLLSLMTAIWDVDANFKREEKIRLLEDTLIKHEHIVQALEARNEEAFEAAMLTHFVTANIPSRRLCKIK